MRIARNFRRSCTLYRRLAISKARFLSLLPISTTVPQALDFISSLQTQYVCLKEPYTSRVGPHEFAPAPPTSLYANEAAQPLRLGRKDRLECP